jgi:hypothetical protein|tara:strand:- start:133 stop:444 length:312 start_codon:yes stop_codon:yes gene_type:complete
MSIEFTWVQRQPALNAGDDNVCQWLLHLRAVDGEAASYISEAVDITKNQKPIGDWLPADIEAMSEAFRRINKWDATLTSDIEEQLNAPRTVDGWNEETLSVDT